MFHDKVANLKGSRHAVVHVLAVLLEGRVLDQVAREQVARLDLLALEVGGQVVTREAGVFLDRNQETEPRRVGIFLRFGEDQSLGPFETFAEDLEIFAAAFNDGVELFELRTADSRLHVGRLEVEAQVAVDVLVVVTHGELAELARKALAAGIVDSAHAPAFASPVTERLHVLVKFVVVGIDGAAFTHGHVVRRIEGARADIADGTGLFPFAVNQVFGAERVAVVLDQP